MGIVEKIIGYLFFFVYNIIVVFCILFAWIFAIILNTKSFTIKNYIKRIFPDIKPLNNSILFHFSSLGEMNAAKPLIDYFLNDKKNVVITVFTETAYKEALSKYNNVYLMPFDFYFIMKKFISKVNPSIVFITETEIWPSFIKISSKKANLFWINGRISNKSFKRYIIIKPFLRFILYEVKKIFVQQENDKIYFSHFVDNKKIIVVGNTKFDLIQPQKNINEDETLKLIKNWKKDAFCAVFGSIHPNEFEIIIKSYNLLKSENISVKYIIVPRHIEKNNKFIELIEKYKIKYCKISELEKEKKEMFTDILLFDKIGYLSLLYSFSDISFVGGTLNNIGGHNLLEPSQYRKVVLFGPNFFNQNISAKKLIENGGGFIAKDEHELKARIKFFYFDKTKLMQSGENSYKTLIELSGSTKKIISNLF